MWAKPMLRQEQRAREVESTEALLEQLPVGPARWLALGRTRLLPWEVFEFGLAKRSRGPRRLRRLCVRARLQTVQRLPGRAFDRPDAVGDPLRRILEPVRGFIAAAMRPLEARRLDPHLLAVEQTLDTGLAGFGARMLAVLAIRLVVRLVVLRLLVGRDVALVVPQHDLAIGVADQVIGHDRDLAAAAGRIHDIRRNGVAGGVAAQALHDLDALANRGAEVTGAFDQIARVDVVRPDR